MSDKETKEERNKRLEKASQEWKDFVDNTEEGQILKKESEYLCQYELDYVFGVKE